MPSISDVTAFISAHPYLAYGAVFLLALSEAVPIVGVIVPGSALIIGISALVPQGIVSVWPLLLAAILGAIAGDGFSYWLGHRYQDEILRRWPLDRHPEFIARSELFFHRHGAKSVFLGRFSPVVRAFIPLLAGILRMPAGQFSASNVFSALAWAPAHILPGILLGASVSSAGPLAGRIAVLLAVIITELWLILSATRYAVRRGVPLTVAARDRLWKWAQARDTWLSRHVRALLDSAHKEAWALALLAAVALGAAWLFFGVLEDVVSGDPLVQADKAIYNLLQGLRTPWFDAVMIAITELGDPVVTTSVAVVAFLWLGSRAWRSAFYWGAAVGFAAIMNAGIKLLVHRARPSNEVYADWNAFSFPSGHSTVNAVIYGFLGFLIARELRPAWRVPVITVALSFAAFIAFSRLYLGAHWFSDVVGSLAFATAWVIVLCVIYEYRQPPQIDVRGLSGLVFATVVLAGGPNVYFRYEADVERYAVRYEVPTVAATDWEAGDWKQLPAYRTDLTGATEEPLTVQWVGSLKSLEEELLQEGWRQPEPWTLMNALKWLTAAPDALKLPVFPCTEAGRMPSLTLVCSPVARADADTRLVLRLWAADLEVRNQDTKSLWIGSVVEERLYRPLSLFTFTRAQQNVDVPRQILARALETGRLAARGYSSKGWDGWVLLAQDTNGPPSSDY